MANQHSNTITLNSIRSMIASRSWELLLYVILLPAMTIFVPAIPRPGWRPEHPPFVSPETYRLGVVIVGVLCGIVFVIVLARYIRLLLDRFMKKEIHYEGAITDIRRFNSTHHIVELGGNLDVRLKDDVLNRAALVKGQRAVLVVGHYSKCQLALVVEG